MTTTTKQDFLDVLQGHPRSNDAIFWYCQAWHDGADDLYRIMCALDHTPRPWSDKTHRKDPITGKWEDNPNYDPELVALLKQLEVVMQPAGQPPFFKVKLEDVREGHVLTAVGLPCVADKWPCRVFRHHGELGVQCSGAVHGIRLLPGSEATFHPLRADKGGYVVGFVR